MVFIVVLIEPSTVPICTDGLTNTFVAMNVCIYFRTSSYFYVFVNTYVLNYYFITGVPKIVPIVRVYSSMSLHLCMLCF